MLGNGHTAARTRFRPVTRLWLQFCVIMFCLGLTAPLAAARPSLTWQSQSDSPTLPLDNSAFQHPTEPHQLFFLQRTLNANTVVYIAKFDANGDLDLNEPVAVFWRRFADQGQIMPLRWYERVFGFGVNLSESPDSNMLRLTFNGLSSHLLELRQTGPFRAALHATINARDYRVIYAYLDVDDSGLLPKVTGLRLYTNDPQTGLYVTHTIAVSGGAFKE